VCAFSSSLNLHLGFWFVLQQVRIQKVEGGVEAVLVLGYVVALLDLREVAVEAVACGQ
jgi:hypothetical protein